jgi:hypothetical protein
MAKISELPITLFKIPSVQILDTEASITVDAEGGTFLVEGIHDMRLLTLMVEVLTNYQIKAALTVSEVPLLDDNTQRPVIPAQASLTGIIETPPAPTPKLPKPQVAKPEPSPAPVPPPLPEPEVDPSDETPQVGTAPITPIPLVAIEPPQAPVVEDPRDPSEFEEFEGYKYPKRYFDDTKMMLRDRIELLYNYGYNDDKTGRRTVVDMIKKTAHMFPRIPMDNLRAAVDNIFNRLNVGK